MSPEETRQILILQAIEQADEEETVISPEDKREGAVLAGAPLEKKSSESVQSTFLAKRAEILLTRVSSRHPKSAHWIAEAGARNRIGLVAVVLGLVAIVIGYLTNELGPEKRINILSFPLLGIVLWSFLVYLREIFLLFRSRSKLFKDGWVDWLVGFVQPARSVPGSDADDSPESRLVGARSIFERRWRELRAPVLGARLKSMLHWIAFLLAASAIAGMYVKGLANEYRAVWESTFFSDSTQLRPFLEVVLGPAASLSGDKIPSPEALEAIHFTANADEPSGESAARWIHWYAITIGIFVLLPRGILAIIWRLKASRFARTMRYREVSSGYFDYILATSTGTSMETHLVPYSISLDDGTKRGLVKRLEQEFERPLDVRWEATVPFGEEEEVTLSIAESSGERIPVFNFASTPEVETHLALYQTLSGLGPNPVRFALLDTSSYDAKSKDFPDFAERKAGRSEAWERLFQDESVDLLLTDL